MPKNDHTAADDTGLWSADGAAGDETVVVEPVTQVAPGLAWSEYHDDDDDVAGDEAVVVEPVAAEADDPTQVFDDSGDHPTPKRSWREAWAGVGAISFIVAIVAIVAGVSA